MSREALEQKIADAIADTRKGDALYSAMRRGRDSRAARLEVMRGVEAFRAETREVKDRCQADSEALLARFMANAGARGAKTFFARDGVAAIEHVLKVAAECGARSLAKSKSLTTEEIELNEPLEHAGVRVVETDLGELIIQLVHEKPYHLVFPAVHKTAQEVAEIFRKETGQEVPADPVSIMKIVRPYLRPIFLNADIGMTGANVGVAETGNIVIETNEGNARLVSSIPDVHICVMGVEKIVDTVEDALKMIVAHPVSATGQPLTTYVTFMAGRNALAGDADSVGQRPRETHVIVLDNGRSQMKADAKLNDALNCIRCGACMNICPTYGVVGGHTFGYIYPGPIGIPWTAATHGLERAGEFAPLCISCGLCKEICPVSIDIPSMIAEVKERDAEAREARGERRPFVERAMMHSDAFARMGSATAPIANWMMRNGLARAAMEAAIGIDRRRTLPSFRRDTLEKRWKRRHGGLDASAAQPGAKGRRRVALFVDLNANYNNPDLGMAVIEALERRGCRVEMPPQTWSGYPYIGYGDLAGARSIAGRNVASFADWIRESGGDVVAIEPTAAYCLRESYPHLFQHEPGDEYTAAKWVAGRSFEFFEFINRLDAENPDTASKAREAEGRASGLQGKRFGFHIACHQRPLGAGRHALEWMRARGADVKVVETGTCCGMAGTFGMKKGALGYDLSMAVGRQLFDLFRESGVEEIVTESSVCALQLTDGVGLPVRHPLELVTRG